jgi:hypothetical protein
MLVVPGPLNTAFALLITLFYYIFVCYNAMFSLLPRELTNIAHIFGVVKRKRKNTNVFLYES